MSFYGDNHPHYAGSVVRRWRAPRTATRTSSRSSPRRRRSTPATQPARDAKLRGALREARRRARRARAPGEPPHAEHRRDRRPRADGGAQVPARAVLPAAELRDVRAGHRLDATATAATPHARRGAPRDGGPRAHGRVGRRREGPARDDRPRDGRQLAPLRGARAGRADHPDGAHRAAHRDRARARRCCSAAAASATRSSSRSRARSSCSAARCSTSPGYKRGEDLFKRDDIERWTDQVIWCTDSGAPIEPRRAAGPALPRQHRAGDARLRRRASSAARRRSRCARSRRIIAIGSDGMMNAVREARHGVLAPLLEPEHLAIGSINSPMQCMMKEVCAQCLQKLRDPVTGQGARRLHVLQPGPGARRGRLPQPARAPARELDAGEAVERVARRDPQGARRGDPRVKSRAAAATKRPRERRGRAGLRRGRRGRRAPRVSSPSRSTTVKAAAFLRDELEASQPVERLRRHGTKVWRPGSYRTTRAPTSGVAHRAGRRAASRS